MRSAMNKTQRSVILAAGIVAVALLAIVATPKYRAESEENTPAPLWLSWSPDQRSEYVWGFLSGFREGKDVGCTYYEDAISEKIPQEPVSLDKRPRKRCLEGTPDFTEPYFSSYVESITRYYTKYPRDRQAGMPRLLLEMAIAPGASIDQIHTKLTQGPDK